MRRGGMRASARISCLLVLATMSPGDICCLISRLSGGLRVPCACMPRLLKGGDLRLHAAPRERW